MQGNDTKLSHLLKAQTYFIFIADLKSLDWSSLTIPSPYYMFVITTDRHILHYMVTKAPLVYGWYLKSSQKPLDQAGVCDTKPRRIADCEPWGGLAAGFPSPLISHHREDMSC